LTLLAEVWELLAGTRELPAEAVVTESSDLLPATLPVAELATSAVLASLLAASQLAAERNHEPASAVTLDARHAAAAFHSERHARVNGVPVGASFAPLSRFWPTADGWIRTHANYAWHEQRLLSVLGCASDPEVVGAAIGRWRAAELEEAIFAANGCAAMAREPEEWLVHPQGRLVSDMPLVVMGRAGAASARTRAASGGAMDGVRVLDLTRAIAGPVCTRTLAAHGADVLRLDSPNLPELEQQWIDSNPGKRSAQVDFATAEGRATLDRLVDTADVVVVGYRPGALERFGLAPDQLSRRDRGVVLVTLCAWADRGHWAERRGFDSLVQAASGIARVEAGARNEPGVLPAQALDHATGYLAAAAAMAGLLRQMTQGGTWHARLSLAQTAAGLLRMPRTDPGASSTGADWDVEPYVVQMPRGSDVVTLVVPPGTLGERRLAWPSAPPAPGADSPEWRRTS
jgi:crotonobetainyl-CoA:carnitine CoA-transferase CaiB-like acyl-CoA transferase